MDLKKIKSLLKIVADSGVAEVEIEEEGFKLVVRKNSATVSVAPPQYFPQGMPAMYPPPGYPVATYTDQPSAGGETPQTPVQQQKIPGAGNGTRAVGEGEGSETRSTPSDSEYVVRAPIVGTFYRRPSPGDDPYVEPGKQVQAGEVLCIIEAMKLMNEIECDVTGIVKKVLVDDSQPVEFDQPLFIISTDKN